MTQPDRIACTLPADAMFKRTARWRRLLAQASGRRQIEGGCEISFPPGAALASEVVFLAGAEQACCPFFAFTVRLTRDATYLEVHAPAEAEAMAAELFGSSIPDPAVDRGRTSTVSPRGRGRRSARAPSR